MTDTSTQPELFRMASRPLISGVNCTFSPNRSKLLHRWYPYLEGFSEDFVLALLDEFGSTAEIVHDPFAGTGTTPIVSALNGRISTYCEINPFMRLVIDAKIKGLQKVIHCIDDFIRYTKVILDTAIDNKPDTQDAKRQLSIAFGDRRYFEDSRLRELIALQRSIADTEPTFSTFRLLANLALASIVVDNSLLIRAGDLRYRKPNELPTIIGSPINDFHEQLDQITADLNSVSKQDFGSVSLLSNSALDIPRSISTTDLIITSPPYLNGTNYFRNTKLELWITNLIENERDLRTLRDEAIAAGINNITNRSRKPHLFSYVEEVTAQLDKVAYDRRIPELIRRYFSDAYIWLNNLHLLLRPGGLALIDIGDSRFAGVPVKTDQLLSKVSSEIGFELEEARFLRERRSRDGTDLKQVLLVLKKPITNLASRSATESIGSKAAQFKSQLPHQKKPLNSRNWGHKWHSLCSYQGKLKPAIAYTLVREFTLPGEVILDPMSGAGTIPLEACLQGRIGWGNDLQDLAFILTHAKVDYQDPFDVIKVAEDLIIWIDRYQSEQDPNLYKEFGFNGRLSEYYHADTYQEILAAREYIRVHPVTSWEQSFVYASLLHILHGNRPYALSRRSHPVIPFKPSGPTEYRPVAPRLMDKIGRMLNQGWPKQARAGKAFHQDLFDLPFSQEVDIVITSPPFAGSTRFFISNWIRLWMAGWEPDNFNIYKEKFIEQRQRNSLTVYRDFFKICHQWLKPNGRLIMHVGQNNTWDMATDLELMARDWFKLVYKFNESVIGKEKFGIRDQGSTKNHQYLFMVRT